MNDIKRQFETSIAETINSEKLVVYGVNWLWLLFH